MCAHFQHPQTEQVKNANQSINPFADGCRRTPPPTAPVLSLPAALLMNEVSLRWVPAILGPCMDLLNCRGTPCLCLPPPPTPVASVLLHTSLCHRHSPNWPNPLEPERFGNPENILQSASCQNQSSPLPMSSFFNFADVLCYANYCRKQSWRHERFSVSRWHNNVDHPIYGLLSGVIPCHSRGKCKEQTLASVPSCKLGIAPRLHSWTLNSDSTAIHGMLQSMGAQSMPWCDIWIKSQFALLNIYILPSSPRFSSIAPSCRMQKSKQIHSLACMRWIDSVTVLLTCTSMTSNSTSSVHMKNHVVQSHSSFLWLRNKHLANTESLNTAPIHPSFRRLIALL